MLKAAPRPFAVDVSRLVTGLRFTAPTGIERWELGYAERLSPGPGVILSPIGARALSPEARRKVVLTAKHAWRDAKAANLAVELAPIISFLQGRPRRRRIVPGRRAWRAGGLLPQFARAAFTLPSLSLPRGTAYLHASFFRLDSPAYFEWLIRRPDIAPVFVLYDLLPLLHPEFFRPGEDVLHRRRIETAARHAAAIVAPCEGIAAALRSHLAAAGLPQPPIRAIGTPLEPEFLERPAPVPGLDAAPYFVVCGTIEPRKNHALLLKVWAQLYAAHGARTPKLLIVGRRGWRNEAVFRQLDALGALGTAVLEAPSLSTAALAALIAQAHGLLSPSFAEGYGMPVAEALALGTPVIAADGEIYRELWRDHATLLPPDDRIGWTAAIEAAADAAKPRSPVPSATWESHLAALTDLVAGL